jgi:hypothetical protein
VLKREAAAALRPSIRARISKYRAVGEIKIAVVRLVTVRVITGAATIGTIGRDSTDMAKNLRSPLQTL